MWRLVLDHVKGAGDSGGMPWEATKISNERDIEKQGFFEEDGFRKVKMRKSGLIY